MHLIVAKFRSESLGRMTVLSLRWCRIRFRTTIDPERLLLNLILERAGAREITVCLLQDRADWVTATPN